MADISVTPKQGGSRSWLWPLLAVALVAALMIWLAMQEGTTSPSPIVEEDTAAAVDGEAAGAGAAGDAAMDTAAAAQ